MSNNAPFTTHQLWGRQATATHAASEGWCTPLILPVGGVIVYNDELTTTLTAQVTFRQPCNNPNPIISPDTTGNSSVIGYQFPFYASISPQIFALATATVISYVLVILIFITPRTFVGSYGGGGGSGRFLSRRGIISSSSSIIGVGRRPLLQKIAAITVAISLTIATADTFSVAEEQYKAGYMDSSILSDDVINSLEIRVIRVISDTFLWLAQVQTLIRLFPRHREKVTIKWLGFAMVTCDTVFSILDSIVSDDPMDRQGERRQQREGARGFQDAIPALNYLFELAISLIYASCVLYYSMSKRRFAYYHPRMKNICLVALVSIMSVLIPVVFFVLDIAKPVVAGWGEYIRWVGAAAASVVVWEWVERIEALERDERKDGILGREIFDADEMLDMTPSEEAEWPGRSGRGGGRGDGEKHTTFGEVAATFRKVRARLPARRRRGAQPTDVIVVGGNAAVSTTATGQTTNTLTVPHPVITPPSRSDTTSAASTVYAIRYHNLTSPSPAIPEDIPGPEPEPDLTEDEQPKNVSEPSTDSTSTAVEKENVPHKPEESQVSASAGILIPRQKWQSMPNPFKRRRAEPPAEVAGAQIASGMRRSPIDRTIHLKERLGAFATSQKDRFARRGSVDPAQLPVMVIPAPRINERTWSPDEVRNNSAQTTDDAAADMYGADDDSSISPPDNVVVIPAPSPGRTWSPGDAVTSATTDTDRPNRESTPSTTKAIPPRQTSSASPALTITPRGSLTISENNPRLPPNTNTTPTGARRLTQTRPVSISPISERLGMESPANRAILNTARTNTSPAPQTASTQNAQPIPIEPESRRDAAVRQTEPSDQVANPPSAADGRDTGGGGNSRPDSEPS